MKKTLLLLAAFLFIQLIHAQDSTTTKHASKAYTSFDKIKSSRFITSDEIGTLIGFSSHAAGKYIFTYQTVNGWQLDRHVYAGVGTGVELTGKKGVMLDEGGSKMAVMIPVFAEIRASVLSKRVSPFFSEKLGYNFYIANPHPSHTIIGGMMAQTQIGIKAFITQQSAFNLSVGYRMQALDVPGVYTAQFNDFQKALPGQVISSRTTEYYHYFLVMVGFTY